MKKFSQNALALSVLSILANSSWAEQAAIAQLETITVNAEASDENAVVQSLNQQQLAQRATTLGDVLQTELGIASSSFGAGSSRPVIRGQDGARVKVTENGGDTMDVSSLSPDHAITVDPQLVEKIEVLRGPATLLYGAGSVGGLVNVVGSKIPSQMPEKGYEGQVGVRYDTGSDQKLAHAGLTVGIGEHVALRVEGLTRHANNYITPDYTVIEEHGDHVHNIKSRRVADSFAESEHVNLGASWIGERGFAGVAYSKRQDKYGLPGHDHAYEGCHLDGLSLVCSDHAHGDDGDVHASDEDHDHDHGHGGPWIDLVSERYDFRSELNDPFKGIEKLHVQAAYTNYHHEEIEGDAVSTRFESKAYEARVALDHIEAAGWTGTWGVQASQQKINLSGEEAIFAPNKTQKYSLFGFEQKQWHDLRFDLGTRLDHQKIDIESQQANYDGTAFSYSGAAHWDFAPDYTLSLTASHQERLPLAQELYADGIHLASNTYELGNDQLGKEKSNNLELAFNYDDQTLSYGVNVYHNWFDDYIYAQTLDRFKDFRLIKYDQASAQFYGVEGKVGYQLSPIYKATVFGDYVRGKIDGENAPRVPAGRLGSKVDAQFDEQWSGSAEYYHVFKQDDISTYEHSTQGYNMLNLGLSYTGQYKAAEEYRVFLNANNLLDDKVYQHASFLAQIPQMGRNFMLGIDVKF